MAAVEFIENSDLPQFLELDGSDLIITKNINHDFDIYVVKYHENFTINF